MYMIYQKISSFGMKFYAEYMREDINIDGLSYIKETPYFENKSELEKWISENKQSMKNEADKIKHEMLNK